MSKTILIAEDPPTRYVIKQLLVREGFQVVNASTYAEVFEHLSQARVDLALIALDLEQTGKPQGLEVLEQLHAQHSCPVVMIAAEDQAESVRELLRAGALDCLLKPVSRELLLPLLRSALDRSQIQRQIESVRRQQGEKFGLRQLVATSAPMQQVKTLIRQVAAHDSSVMILGESGTGKEMVARAIHMESERKNGPFIPINCGAIPEELVEAELFGYERGAFTGAIQSRLGHFEAAHEGTLFLDEIGEMPLPMQVKLLRVLEERKVTRIGARHTTDLTCRVLCATNANLEADVEAGAFRQDLYYRLNVISIPLPPLRARGEDTVLLAEAFIQDLAGQELKLQPEARQVLRDWRWPGNVRELRNAVERAVVLSGTRLIEINRHLIEHCKEQRSSARAPSSTGGRLRRFIDEVTPALDVQRSAEERLDQLLSELLDARDDAGEPDDDSNLLEHLEARAILAAYQRSGRNKARAARLLGIERKAFERRIARLLPE